MTVFEHPQPAKDPDAIRSFVGTVQSLVAVEHERDTAQRDLMAAHAEIEELSGHLDDADAEVARLKGEIELMDGHLDDADTEVRAEQHERRRRTAEVEQLEAELRSLRSEIPVGVAAVAALERVRALCDEFPWTVDTNQVRAAFGEPQKPHTWADEQVSPEDKETPLKPLPSPQGRAAEHS